jgi:ribosomal protein L35AE/L33A
MMTAGVSLQVTMVDRGRTMIPSTTLLLKLPVCFSNSNQHDRVISSHVLVNTHTCVNERITDMMLAGPFVAGLKCSGNVFWGDSVHLHGKEGLLQLIVIHMITLHNILEYIQIAIIQTEAADFVKINIYVILKNVGHDCSVGMLLHLYQAATLNNVLVALWK